MKKALCSGHKICVEFYLSICYCQSRKLVNVGKKLENIDIHGGVFVQNWNKSTKKNIYVDSHIKCRCFHIDGFLLCGNIYTFGGSLSIRQFYKCIDNGSNY